MNQLVVFDLGETLVSYQGVALNWSSNYYSAITLALNELGIETDDAQLEMAVEILDFYNTRTNSRCFEVDEGEVLSKVARVFNAKTIIFERLFFRYFQRTAIPENTAFETLKTLRSWGIKLAVLSDVPYGMPKTMIMDDLGKMTSLFDTVCSSCEVGFRKPHPIGLERLVARFEIAPKNAIYIGNEAKDMQCAIAAGVTSVLLDPDGKRNFGQSYSIKSLAELLPVVR